MDLQHIPLSHLKIAAVNVRHARKAPDVSDILPSIRARGILQPLLVRPSGKSFEIIAGRRRFFAASQVAEEQGVSAEECLLPCAVTAKGDDAGAVEASLIENVARAAMDELEEYEAFAKLLKQGRSVGEIARTFGVTELYVRQRLALAGLHGKIKQAYRDGEIEPEELQLLSSASRQQQKEWVTAFEAARNPDNEDADDAPRGHQLKRWLFGDERIATGVARFVLDDYKDGIVTDLFADVGYFSNVDAFWTLQNAAIARLRDELAAQGWTVSVLAKGERFQVWQHVEVCKEDGGNAYVEVRDSGEVEIHQGYLPRGRQPARQDGSTGEGGEGCEGGEGEAAAPATRGELTKAAENYLALHRHAIVRAELLAAPAIALRLAVAHMIAGSPLWSVKPEPQRAEKETTATSLAASQAQAAFETERQAILQLLDLEPAYLGTLARCNQDTYWGALVFARLLPLPDETVLRVLALAMAECLASSTALVEAAGASLKIDVARWWSADAAFLDLIRDRKAVNAMLSEVAGKAVADANIAATAKVQKKIIADCLSGEGRAQVDAWVPRYMAFPITHYDPEKTLQIEEGWTGIKDLFTA